MNQDKPNINNSKNNNIFNIDYPNNKNNKYLKLNQNTFQKHQRTLSNKQLSYKYNCKYNLCQQEYQDQQEKHQTKTNNNKNNHSIKFISLRNNNNNKKHKYTKSNLPSQTYQNIKTIKNIQYQTQSYHKSNQNTNKKDVHNSTSANCYLQDTKNILFDKINIYQSQRQSKQKQNYQFLKHTLPSSINQKQLQISNQNSIYYTTQNTFNHTLVNSSASTPKNNINQSIKNKLNNINYYHITNNLNQINNQPKKPKILNKQKNNLLCSIKSFEKIINKESLSPISPSSFSFKEQFKLGRALGKGKFGKVYTAQHLKTGSLYAAKQINTQKITQKHLERLIAQIKIQSFVNHQNCLALYNFYKQADSFYLILQLGQSSLFELLRENRFFSQKQTASYIKQVIKALMYLHERGIIHRDLKPQNIVLVQNTVKLADFGWSAIINENDKRQTFCGTLDYISPEIVLGRSYDTMVDVWSLGILCYQLCTGNAPFQSHKNDKNKIYEKIMKVDLKFPKHLSKGAQNFIKLLLNRRPSHRMSLQQALQHPWIKQFDFKE